MDRFKDVSPEDQDLVLRLGFACYDRAGDLLNNDLQDRYTTEITHLKESQRNEITRMRAERDTIVQERVNTALNAVRNERTHAIDSMCDTIRKDREHETGELRKNMEIVMGQMRSLIQEHRNAHEGSTKEMMGVIDSLKGSASNSAIRGRIGESTTETMLDQILPGCTWENTSSTGGKADFHVTIPGIGKVLMDIKNHEKDHGGVPLRDRKKLIRDLDAEKDAVGAILIATQAKIHSGSHCQVVLSESRKPVVCCLLHGDWDRLRDGIETLRACLIYKQEQGQSTENKSEHAIDSLREILKLLCLQEESVLDTRKNVVRAMTEVNIALSQMDPEWNPSLREWLMVRLKHTDQVVAKNERMTLKSLREMPDIPKEAKGKSGRDKLRDEMISLGIVMNADGSMPYIHSG